MNVKTMPKVENRAQVENRAREIGAEFTQCGQRKFKEAGIPEVVTIKVSYDLQITRETLDRLYDSACRKNGIEPTKILQRCRTESQDYQAREAVVLNYLREYGFYGS